MVGRVGYAPCTPAMSMQYSTIELTALIKFYLKKETIQVNSFLLWKKLVFLLHAYIKEKFNQKRVKLKSLKKEPLGNNGKKFINK